MKIGKIKISLFSLAFIGIMGMGGMLKEILISFLIIIIHECGHLLFILLFKGKLKKFNITPVGGILNVEFKTSSKIKRFLVNTGRNC